LENFVAADDVVVASESETFFWEVFHVPKKKLFAEVALELILVVA